MRLSPVVFVGRQIDLSAICGDNADLQTLCEDGRWSARIRYLHVEEVAGINERGAVLALAASFRNIAERLEREAEDLGARPTTQGEKKET